MSVAANDDRDRRTPVPTKDADWRSDAFDIAAVETPYALRVLQGGLKDLDDQNRRVAQIVQTRIRDWERTIDRRIKMAVKLAAEEAADRVATKILRELADMQRRVAAIEGDVDKAEERASQAEILAKKAVDETGRHQPVHVNIDLPTPPPPKLPSDSPPSIIRYAVKRYRWARYVGIAIGVIAAGIWSAWLAWKAVHG